MATPNDADISLVPFISGYGVHGDGTGFPVCWRQLADPDSAPYDPNGMALVRPDGIIADCWSDAEIRVGDVEARLRKQLPLRDF